MTLKTNNVPSTGSRQEPVESGTYPGRLVQVIDLGLQPQTYNGETKEPKIEIFTTYELADEFMKDDDGNDIEDKPRWLSESFTLNSLSSDRAKSTARYYALDPDAKHEGDWSKLLGTPASITIVQNAGKGKNKGKVYNNISAVSTMRARDAQRLPDLKNEPKFFDQDEPDVELFLTLPSFIQDKVKAGLNFDGSKLDELLQKHKGSEKKETKKEEVDDSIPFDEDEKDETNW